jgi:CubicO group peptidase (beta-lactamase class C family)
MITMMYVVGTLARDLGYVNVNELKDECISGGSDDVSSMDGVTQCYYLAYVHKYVIGHSAMVDSGFLVNPLLYGQCAPTWNDTNGFSPDGSYRNRVIQGQASDENAYAMGGISGHAGFFSTGLDVHRLLSALMFTTPTNKWINATTLQTFTTIYNVSQSSRALGWDTNNYAVRSYPGCGNFSQNTYMHTGYTGTQVCNDKDRQMYAILLTNRVYPYADAASEAAITEARILFSNAVVAAYDAGVAREGDTLLHVRQ